MQFNKNQILVLAGFFIVLTAAFILSQNKDNPRANQVNNAPSQLEEKGIRLDPGIDDARGVMINLAPAVISEDLPAWRFTLELNTHSVELSDDMQSSSVLVDDAGEEHPAISWQGSGPGGHHRKGTLVFKSIVPIPKILRLRLKNIGGEPQRDFIWNTSSL